MKKQFLFFLLAGFLFASCGGEQKPAVEASDDTQEAATASAEATSFTVDTDASVINWEGYKPAQYGHVGTIKVQSGSFDIKDGAPESGNFVLDMNSLVNTDIEDPEKRANLEGHLKSGDFFEVEKFPTASFEVTGVTAGGEGVSHTVTGNLTMKGITKSVNIPANVSVSEGKVTIETPEFTINRTEWDVKFNSGVIGTIGDKIIADDVKLKITLVGNAG